MESVMSQNEQVVTQVTPFGEADFSFELGNMNGSADYIALFDSYRILKAEVTIRPTITTGVAGCNPPTLYTVIDYDDSNALGSAQLFREYSNCMLTQYETVVRMFTPHVNNALRVNGGGATGFGSVRSPWCDAASTTIEHFGLKLGLDGGAGSVPQNFIVNFRFMVEWRTTR